MKNKKNPAITPQRERYLLNRLVKCGDLLGDGDLDPEFEREVRREYRAITNELYPDIKKEISKAKADNRNKLVNSWLTGKGLKTACHSCSSIGDFKQSRKGALCVICCKCNSKYKLK